MSKHEWKPGWTPPDWLLFEMLGYIFDNRMAGIEGKHRDDS